MDNLITTLCLVVKDNKVLLGMKKRGFGAGRWNGFGGKLKDGESVLGAALRELEEESGLVAEDIEERGVIRFHFEGQEKVIEVRIFKASSFFGEPRESEEMSPSWFPLDAMPFETMWPSDHLWLPIFLSDKHFVGEVHFDHDGQRTIAHEFREIPGDN